MVGSDSLVTLSAKLREVYLNNTNLDKYAGILYCLEHLSTARKFSF